MIKNFDWKLSSKVFLLLGLCIGCHHSFSYAQLSSALKNVEVKIDCSSVLSKVEKYCNGNDHPDNAAFSDSSTPPSINPYWSGGCMCRNYTSGKGWQCNSNVYKHTLPSGAVMYSSSDDPKRFVGDMVTTKCKWSFNPMDVLEVLPEIGISRVDPNLIEY